MGTSVAPDKDLCFQHSFFYLLQLVRTNTNNEQTQILDTKYTKNYAFAL